MDSIRNELGNQYDSEPQVQGKHRDIESSPDDQQEWSVNPGYAAKNKVPQKTDDHINYYKDDEDSEVEQKNVKK
jgi:hypothetical protein